MNEIIPRLFNEHGLVASFALVGIVMWISYQISKHLTLGRIHGSAIAIVLGLILAYFGGVATGGKTGIADIPLFAGGTVAKLIDEGYTGYLIRVSNDEAAGRTLGYGVVQNEKDIQGAAKALGCKKAFSFYYRNHRMDDNAAIEIRARSIFLFRMR